MRDSAPKAGETPEVPEGSAPESDQTPMPPQEGKPVPPGPDARRGTSEARQEPDGLARRAGKERPVIQGALSMEQAVQVALRESPIVRGAVAEVEAAIGQVGVARAQTRPMVSANSFVAGGSMRNILTTTEPVTPRMIQPVGPGSFFDQNLMLMYPLYTGGRLGALVRQAEAARRAEGEELEAVRLEVATMTRIAYRTVQYQQALAGVHEALAASHRERLRITQAAFGVGKVPRYYVLRDEAEVANAVQQLTNVRRDAEQAMVQLKTWMGVSLASDLRLTEPLRFEPVTAVLRQAGLTNLPPDLVAETSVQPEAAETDPAVRTAELGTPNLDLAPQRSEVLPALLSMAERQRPELAAIQARLMAGRAGVRAARSLYQPQVSAGAMADLMRRSGEDFVGGTTFGVVASLPILDGGLRRAQVREARAEADQLEQTRERVLLEVHQQVTDAWLALQAAAQNVRTAETGLRAAQEDYRVVLARYEAGKGINVEVLDAIAARTRAETNVAQALYQYGVAKDQLLRAVGHS